MRVDTAVILSAGATARPWPPAQTMPNALPQLEGRPILGTTLDRLRQAGVENIIVNAPQPAGRFAEFLAAYPEVVLSSEDESPDAAGAIIAMHARGLLPDRPFFIIDGDSFWVDGPGDTLGRLAAAFRPDATDAMLLLVRAVGAIAETGRGEFLWPRDGGLKRREERDVAPYLYAGVQIVTPALFAPPPCSIRLLWDRALAAGRLDAIVHDGLWFHFSAPDDLARADAVLDAREVGYTT